MDAKAGKDQRGLEVMFGLGLVDEGDGVGRPVTETIKDWIVRRRSALQ